MNRVASPVPPADPDPGPGSRSPADPPPDPGWGPRLLRVAPALDAGDAAFLAGFSRHAVPSHGQQPRPDVGAVTRIWPGQPAVASPWVPCADGCCLALAPARVGVDAAGQWLRFLIAEFLGARHHVVGRVEVPGGRGRRSLLIMVEGNDVFEAESGEEGGLAAELTEDEDRDRWV